MSFKKSHLTFSLGPNIYWANLVGIKVLHTNGPKRLLKSYIGEFLHISNVYNSEDEYLGYFKRIQFY